MKPVSSVLALLAVLTASSLSAFAVSPPDSSAAVVELDHGTTIYDLDRDLVYDGETSISFKRPDAEPGQSDLELTFRGVTGDESIVFDHQGNATPYIDMYNKDYSATLTFEHLNDVTIGNATTPTGTGKESIYVSGDKDAKMIFRDIKGSVNVSNNLKDVVYVFATLEARSYDGDAYIGFNNVGGDIIFDNNEQINSGAIDVGGGYGPSTAPTSHVAEFVDVGGKVSFSNNFSIRGGAIYVSNTSKSTFSEGEERVSFKGIGQGVYFENNRTVYTGTGAAISIDARSNGNSIIEFEDIGGPVVFDGNISENSHGGAISIFNTESSARFSISDVTGDVRFTNNTANGAGGAILLVSSTLVDFSISGITGDVIFDGNKAVSDNANQEDAHYGGAIYAQTDEGGMINMLLSADGGNITFRNNTHQDGLPNAMLLTGSTDVELRAAAGRTVEFYDPVDIQNDTPETGSNVLNINKESGYTGAVVFSTGATAGDYTNKVAGDINVYRGALKLERGVTLGAAGDPEAETPVAQADFYMYGGVLDISGSAEHGVSTLNAVTIDFTAADASSADARILKGGSHSVLNAQTIDMSEGIHIDLGYYLANGAHDGVKTIAELFITGGVITICDDDGFYDGSSWSSNQTFALFDASEATVIGAFDGIISMTSGLDVVDDKGQWSLEWRGDTLYADWISFHIIPEPASALLVFGGLSFALLQRRRKGSVCS